MNVNVCWFFFFVRNCCIALAKKTFIGRQKTVITIWATAYGRNSFNYHIICHFARRSLPNHKKWTFFWQTPHPFYPHHFITLLTFICILLNLYSIFALKFGSIEFCMASRTLFSNRKNVMHFFLRLFVCVCEKCKLICHRWTESIYFEKL